MGHGLPGADEVPRLGVRGGKIVALGQTPGRGDQHKLDTRDALLYACKLAIHGETCVCEGGECLYCILTAAVKAAEG